MEGPHKGTGPATTLAVRTDMTIQRVIVADMEYLNRRVTRACPICDRETLQDPHFEDGEGNPTFKCCSCDIVNRDSEDGILVLADEWTKF
jgi:hypothetical protein